MLAKAQGNGEKTETGQSLLAFTLGVPPPSRQASPQPWGSEILCCQRSGIAPSLQAQH